MIHPDVSVRQTHKGLGIFANRDFKKGEILWIIDDHDVKIPLANYNALDNRQRQKLDVYSYMDIHHRVIVPWDEGKYVNHSCAPNSTGLAQFDNISIALRDIQADEEIVEDYSSYFLHFETFQCQCGADNCRGLIAADTPYRGDLRLDLDTIGDTILAHDQYLLSMPTKENHALLVLLAQFEPSSL